MVELPLESISQVLMMSFENPFTSSKLYHTKKNSNP